MDERDYKAMNNKNPKVKKSEMLEMIKGLESRLELLEGVKTKTIDQPQYEIGATYVFEDNEDGFEIGLFSVGKLESFDLTKGFPFKRKYGSVWRFARRIEYTLK